MRALLEAVGAMIRAPGGRPLFAGLNLRLSRERVALVGRNGVGKSTLLAVLAGVVEAQEGRITASGALRFVPQAVPGAWSNALSHGERRVRALTEARSSGAEILLLDEPTEDLDEAGVVWLREWLRSWSCCLVVASHDRRLLEDFRDFFVVSESGCRHFAGSLEQLEREMDRDHDATERRYAAGLHRLADHEERALHLARRRARKKRYGRCSEIDRATPRMRLNQKRDHAQVSHGHAAGVRAARLEAIRQWMISTRRALDVQLSIELAIPSFPPRGGEVTDALVLQGIAARARDRSLFESFDLRIGRQRVAVIGPNGAGKTTLLDIMMGRRLPAEGTVRRELARIGSIAHGGADWMLEESLLTYLRLHGLRGAPDDAATSLAAHKFPLALAVRPMRSLSPGERARAALIALFRRAPAVDLLVLDEPTYSLDLVGQRAMIRALRAWPGGLVVASHDRAFLSAIGVDEFIELGPRRAGA